MYEPLPPIFNGLTDADRRTALQHVRQVAVGADERRFVGGHLDPTGVRVASWVSWGRVVVSTVDERQAANGARGHAGAQLARLGAELNARALARDRVA
ncbi:MAG: hypothetical protein ABMB14_38290, partial [Myxococcota bacterium]